MRRVARPIAEAQQPLPDSRIAAPLPPDSQTVAQPLPASNPIAALLLRLEALQRNSSKREETRPPPYNSALARRSALALRTSTMSGCRLRPEQTLPEGLALIASVERFLAA
jgi:hypothetical protein